MVVALQFSSALTVCRSADSLVVVYNLFRFVSVVESVLDLVVVVPSTSVVVVFVESVSVNLAVDNSFDVEYLSLCNTLGSIVVFLG